MSHALLLAPFADTQLARLSLRMKTTQESWLQTGKLYDPDELADRIVSEHVSYLVIEADFVFAETLEHTPDLQLIGLCRNALNHVDLDAATQHGVLVVNTPGRNAVAVAELTIGMMLGLARHIPAAHQHVVSKGWVDPASAYGTYRGTELAGKTAGVIGLGAIGRLVARRLQAMDMRVIAFDPYVGIEVMRALEVEAVPLDTLLSSSDYVLVHAPPMESTLGMIGKQELARMKRSAFLVNTSAPGVCVEADLASALREGSIAGAALDVFDGQPLPTSSPLLHLSNVLLTPHIGGATVETIERYSRMIVDSILAVEEGRDPDHLANPAAWEQRLRKRAKGAPHG